jgi:Flp pilus assembly protein TadB
MPEYDFAATVKEEVAQLERELAAADVLPALPEMAQRFGVSEGAILAALWRACKRHGETLSVFLGELRAQFAREAAEGGPSAGSPGGGPS